MAQTDYTFAEDNNSGVTLPPAELPGQGRGQQFWFVILYTARVLMDEQLINFLIT